MCAKKIRKAASGHTLQEALALFLAQYKKQSQETYRNSLKTFTTFIEVSRRIDTITEMDILAYQNHVEGRDLAKASRSTYFRAVKIFFNWLVKVNLLEESPARFLKAPRVSSPVEKEKAMTDMELKQALDLAKWNLRDFALYLFLADTGGRAGGAAGLRWDDIDFEKHRAFVTEKGDKARPVSFGPVCARALQSWKARRPERAGEYVFSARKRPLKADSISQIIRRVLVRAGGRSLGSHSLRHRKGHQLAYGHTPPTLAAQAMGHSNPNTTLEAYYPVSWSKVDEIMRGFAISDEDIGSQITPIPSSTKEKERPRLIVLKKGG